MKNIFIILFIMSNIILITSCNDQVEPKTEINETYALTCIIRGDTSLQVATITSSYNVDGFNPLTNTTSPFIKGAKIILTDHYTGKTYQFSDTTVTGQSGINYNTPINIYSLHGYKPDANGQISIEAQLPNGRVLKSNSVTYFVSEDFIDINSYLFPIPSIVNGSALVFKWDRLSMRNKIKDVYFAPELVIKYFKIENGNQIPYEKKIPYDYTHGLTEDYPKYTPLLKDLSQFSFDSLVVGRSMEEISSGDPQKENYIIDQAVFRLFILDKELATYYITQKTFNEDFSVRVVQPNYSNIDGGLGIFGTLNSAQVEIYISHSYIKSFGYGFN
jgi:hypothetical protein